MKAASRKQIIGAAALAVLLGGPAFAHHSFAMFDRTQQTTVVGTVKDWQFTNPHAYLDITAPAGSSGEMKQWSLETGSISGLLRKGYRRDTYKPGDKVSVKIHPLRNGTPGGEIVEVTSADGTVRNFYGPDPAATGKSS